MTPVVGYWSLRALAEPIRTLLAYTGTRFENKTYDIGPGPSYSMDQWFGVKGTLGLDLPNLPYYIDGNIRISESSAILRHIARQHSLAGNTEAEKIRIDVAQGVLDDMFKAIVKMLFSKDFDGDKTAYLADISTPVKKCSVLLGSGDYVAGAQISFVDFVLLETLDRFEEMSPGCLGNFQSLGSFQQRMVSLPAIKSHRESPFFQEIKTRFYGRMCKIGSGEGSY